MQGVDRAPREIICISTYTCRENGKRSHASTTVSQVGNLHSEVINIFLMTRYRKIYVPVGTLLALNIVALFGGQPYLGKNDRLVTWIIIIFCK